MVVGSQTGESSTQSFSSPPPQILNISPKRLHHSIRSSIKFFRICRGAKYILLVQNMFTLASMQAFLFSLFTDNQIVFVMHGMLMPGCLHSKYIKKWLFLNLLLKPMLLNRSASLLALSEHEKESLPSFLKSPRIKVSVAGPIIDSKLNVNLTHINSMHGINGRYIAYVGRFNKVKKMSLLTQAFRD